MVTKDGDSKTRDVDNMKGHGVESTKERWRKALAVVVRCGDNRKNATIAT